MELELITFYGSSEYIGLIEVLHWSNRVYSFNIQKEVVFSFGWFVVFFI